MRKLWGLLFIGGYYHFPGEDEYWSTEVIRQHRFFFKKRFLDIKKYFHIAANQNLANSKNIKDFIITAEKTENRLSTV